MHGLTDPLCGYNMGQTAEKVAYQFGVTREDMDAFAAHSHQLAVQAREKGHYGSLATLYSHRGRAFEKDDGVRDDSSIAKLSKLIR